ncbi:MAG: Dolichyl-phosphate-mannose-protein mannosyltransferase [Mucilaginibacter sp.]|nr:Dolichyl-phosphate-mannose-protein mannosyltransferase [Mucilaginibacter sp.]
MSIKNDLQLKLASFAQKGRWNNILVKIISAQLSWILIISAIVRSVYYTALLNTQVVDTASYINYHANLLMGETDGRRTPVYPYFIKLIGLFGHQNLIGHVITAQMVISFLSIIIFYKVVQACFKKRAVIFAASLLYGVMLPVINFDKIVITESLSVTCSLIFIYMMAAYLQKPGNIKAWLLTLYVFIAIMLRPSFIYLLPLIMAFWFLRWMIFKKDWKMCLSGLAASVVVILLILGYSNLNKRNVDFNGISLISNNNEMAVIEQAGIYMYGNDPEISAAVKSNLCLSRQCSDQKGLGINIAKRYSPERIHQFIVACIKNQPVVYALHMCGKLIDLQSANIFTNYADHKLTYLAFRVNNIEYLIFCVTFNLLYILIAFSLALIIYSWIRSKQVPWFKMVLWLLITGQMAVAIIGGYSEYQRLILAVMPALIILVFSYIDKIYFAIDHDKWQRYPASV